MGIKGTKGGMRGAWRGNKKEESGRISRREEGNTKRTLLSLTTHPRLTRLLAKLESELAGGCIRDGGKGEFPEGGEGGGEDDVVDGGRGRVG